MTDRVEFAYDLFISYASADCAWVEGYLLDALSQAGVCCRSGAAFALGVPRLLEFERAIHQSQCTLFDLSPAHLAASLTELTDLPIQSYDLGAATWPVIFFILQPVELPFHLAVLTVLNDQPDSMTKDHCLPLCRVAVHCLCFLRSRYRSCSQKQHLWSPGCQRGSCSYHWPPKETSGATGGWLSALQRTRRIRGKISPNSLPFGKEPSLAMMPFRTPLS